MNKDFEDILNSNVDVLKRLKTNGDDYYNSQEVISKAIGERHELTLFEKGELIVKQLNSILKEHGSKGSTVFETLSTYFSEEDGNGYARVTNTYYGCDDIPTEHADKVIKHFVLCKSQLAVTKKKRTSYFEEHATMHFDSVDSDEQIIKERFYISARFGDGHTRELIDLGNDSKCIGFAKSESLNSRTCEVECKFEVSNDAGCNPDPIVFKVLYKFWYPCAKNRTHT